MHGECAALLLLPPAHHVSGPRRLPAPPLCLQQHDGTAGQEVVPSLKDCAGETGKNALARMFVLMCVTASVLTSAAGCLQWAAACSPIQAHT